MLTTFSALYVYTQCTSINDGNFLGRLWKEALWFFHKRIKTFWTFCSLFAINFLTCSNIGILYQVPPSLPSSDLYFWYWQGNLQADQQIRLCDFLRSFCPAPAKTTQKTPSKQCCKSVSKWEWLTSQISDEGVNLLCGKIACYVQSLGD